MDDDEDVHQATKMALDSIGVLNRELEFAHAYTAAEADALLENDRDFAVVLLDVVMERADAGLKLVQRIREKYGMTLTRIVLRTGQPGHAPEIKVINEYDINDYITKINAVSSRLYTAVASAIKSYDQLERLDRMNRAMEQILRCTNALLETKRLGAFAQKLIEYAPAVLPSGTNIAFAYAGKSTRYGMIDMTVFGASEKWAHLVQKDQPLDENRPHDAQDGSPLGLMQRALDSGTGFSEGRFVVSYANLDHGREIVLAFELPSSPDLTTTTVLQLLLNSVKVCATRLALMRMRLEESMLSMGILAHEFRTPLASIRLNTEHLKESLEVGIVPSEKRMLKSLSQTLKIVDGMNDHINRSMTNVGVVFKEDYLLPVADTDLCRLVADVIETHRGLFERVGEPLLDAPESLFAVADKATLEQVVLNLLSNAVKALIRLEAKPVEPAIRVVLMQEKLFAVIRVEDHGVGMTPKEASRIFEPFVSTNAEPSHGLGLTMVKKGVTAMGGEVSCTSERGVGTTVEIRLALSV